MRPCVDHGLTGTKGGYATGRVVLPDGTVRKTTVHREVFYRHNGYLPPIVRHTCDNPRCKEPTHLVGGTQKDNVADMYARGRENNPGSPGERNGRAVLTDEQCGEIRRVYVKNSRLFGLPSLARKYGVGTSQIWRIITGEQRAETI